MAITLNNQTFKQRKLGIRDVFAFSRIANKMDIKAQFKDLAIRGAQISTGKLPEGVTTDEAQMELGVDMMYTLFTNLGNAEMEFFEWLAGLYGTTTAYIMDYLDDQIDLLVSDFMDNPGKEGFLRTVRNLMELAK